MIGLVSPNSSEWDIPRLFVGLQPVLFGSMSSDRFDPKERAREKQLSREQDERDLASGAKSREQLVRENSRIVLRSARMVLSKSKRRS